ncbi:MAG: hypothetical protein AUJ57_04700 [Zetaproteobacteria bacterium CG1_02_53_45]|nr:MAG: hypothetical protein AUJ57_04700 [Zetaproteobacteria bacterium CG1_02_53_45]
MSAPVTFEGNLIRSTAILLSLLLHGLLFISYGGTPAATMQQTNPSVTRLSFLAPAPEPILTPEALPEPEKKLVKAEPEPIPRQQKKRLVKRMVEPVQEVAQKQISEPVVAAAQPAAAATAPQIDQGLIIKETERYLAEVMAHIEQHKWYPKAARRRGIEGEVHVSFKLLPDGSAHQLVVENGPSLLVTAARAAVERAIPMPIPPAMIDCPLECEFRMRFNLKRS